MEKHLQLPQESVKGWKLCWFSKASYDLCAEDQPRLGKWKPKNIKPWPVFTCHSERDLVWCLRCNRKSTNSSLADLPYTSRDIPNKILIPAMKWAKKMEGTIIGDRLLLHGKKNWFNKIVTRSLRHGRYKQISPEKEANLESTPTHDSNIKFIIVPVHSRLSVPYVLEPQNPLI